MQYSQTIKQLEADLFSNFPGSEKYYNVIKGLMELEQRTPTAPSKPYVIREAFMFDKNATTTDLILLALKFKNHVLQASDIVYVIKGYDTTFERALSAPLFRLKNTNKIQIFNPSITEENPTGSNQQVYYGLPEWFEGENKVKKEYMDDFLKSLY
jgi:hypothetical protein